jgi:hypothetical protein
MFRRAGTARRVAAGCGLLCLVGGACAKREGRPEPAPAAVLSARAAAVDRSVAGEGSRSVPTEARRSSPDAASVSADSGAAPPPSALPPSEPRWPLPEADLSADRLYERVDGAEPVLQALGCRRLVAWRLDPPAAEVELLVFGEAGGAKRALHREVGPERTPGVPGDEGWTNDQVVYFRSGNLLVKIVADVPRPAGTLGQLAWRFERALATGEIRP